MAVKDVYSALSITFFIISFICYVATVATGWTAFTGARNETGGADVKTVGIVTATVPVILTVISAILYTVTLLCSEKVGRCC